MLIDVTSGSGAVVRGHWRSPSKQGATRGHPTNKELELHIGPLFPARMCQHGQRHVERTQRPTTSVARAPTGNLQISPGFFRFSRNSQQQCQAVSHGEGKQQAAGAFGDVYFQPQAPQPQVRFKVAETLLDLHALSVQRHDRANRQPCAAMTGN